MIPPILKQDIRQRTISQLSQQEMQSLKSAILSLQILDIDHVHESFLPWLAWWFRTEQWDDAWPIEQRRAAVKESLILFRYKGTPWAVQRAIKLNGFDSDLIEWHKQVPIGINGTFCVKIPINADVSRSVNSSTQAAIRKAIMRNKRGSQHWSIEYTVHIENTLYMGCFNERMLDVSITHIPPNPISGVTIHCTPYAISNINVRLTVNE
ncbi:phage tail protein I [Photobacterium piscicola]|uniref:phage tail protein I n=1 Tax=Photobacterium piscicola TaxID=1378299 RepID=UPI003736ED21